MKPPESPSGSLQEQQSSTPEEQVSSPACLPGYPRDRHSHHTCPPLKGPQGPARPGHPPHSQTPHKTVPSDISDKSADILHEQSSMSSPLTNEKSSTKILYEVRSFPSKHPTRRSPVTSSTGSPLQAVLPQMRSPLRADLFEVRSTQTRHPTTQSPETSLRQKQTSSMSSPLRAVLRKM